MGLFNLEEQHHIMKMAQELYLEMKIPDMRYFILNTVQDLVQNEFFKPLEILQGMSIADIYLSDYSYYRTAVHKFKANEEGDIKQTYLEDLLAGDSIRKEAFKQLNFFPKNLMIHHDFNFDTLLNRGLQMNSLKSIKLIINYIFEER